MRPLTIFGKLQTTTPFLGTGALLEGLRRMTPETLRARGHTGTVLSNSRVNIRPHFSRHRFRGSRLEQSALVLDLPDHRNAPVRPAKNRGSDGKGKVTRLLYWAQVNLGMGFEMPVERSRAALARAQDQKIRQWRCCLHPSQSACKRRLKSIPPPGALTERSRLRQSPRGAVYTNLLGRIYQRKLSTSMILLVGWSAWAKRRFTTERAETTEIPGALSP